MTELVWEGKYKDGKKVAPVRIALPFQTIETVNESAQERQRSLDLFASGREPEWRNRLIWGDKKYLLPSLLPEFAAKVDLIYIDPPFDTGADFSFIATIPDNPETEDDEATTFVKEPSIIEQKAYRDTWGVSSDERMRGIASLDKYLRWFYGTMAILHEVLSESGTIYVHLDWHVSHYAKTIMDEVFGQEKFMSEIVWKRTIGGTSIANRYRTQTDSILVFTKSSDYTFNEQFTKGHLTEQQILEKFPLIDPVLGRYCIDNLANPDYRPNLMYEYKGYKPPAKGWAISLDKMKQWDAEGRIFFPQDKNNRIRRKRFLSE